MLYYCVVFSLSAELLDSVKEGTCLETKVSKDLCLNSNTDNLSCLLRKLISSLLPLVHVQVGRKTKEGMCTLCSSNIDSNLNNGLNSKPIDTLSTQILWTKLNVFHVREVLNLSFMKVDHE